MIFTSPLSDSLSQLLAFSFIYIFLIIHILYYFIVIYHSHQINNIKIFCYMVGYINKLCQSQCIIYLKIIKIKLELDSIFRKISYNRRNKSNIEISFKLIYLYQLIAYLYLFILSKTKMQQRPEVIRIVIEKFDQFMSGTLPIVKADIQYFQNKYKEKKHIPNQKKIVESQFSVSMLKNIKTLIAQKQKHSILFFEFLIPQFRTIIINMVEKYFSAELSWEFQRMYMDKQKQLLIHKNIKSVINYLRKYRFPKSYQKKKRQCDQYLQKFQIQSNIRNEKVSNDQDLEQINQKLDQINEILHQKLYELYKIIEDVMNDFKQQEKKNKIVFKNINTKYLEQVIKVIKKYQYCQQIKKFSKSLVDILIYKYQRIDPQISYAQIIKQQTNQQKIQQYSYDKNLSDDDELISQPNKIIQYQLLRIQFKKAHIRFKKPYDNGSPIKKYIVYKIIDKQLIQQFQVLNTTPKSNLYVNIQLVGFGFCEFTIKAQNQIGKSVQYQIFKVYIPDRKNSRLFMLTLDYEEFIPIEFQNLYEPVDVYKQVNNVSIRSSAILISDDKGNLGIWGQVFQSQDKQKISKCLQQPFSLGCKFVTKISCGENYYLFCDAQGRAYGFGKNSKYELGLGQKNKNINTYDPLQINFFTQKKIFIVDIVASKNHSMSLDSEGNAYVWGLNQIERSQNQILNNFGDIINFSLGPFDQYYQPQPRKINKQKLNIKRITKIAAGSDFCAIISDIGELYMWGKNIYGQLGNGQLKFKQKNIFYILDPIKVKTFNGQQLRVKDIKLGQQHCLALVENKYSKNKLYSWGNSSINQCGHGIKKTYLYPKEIEYFYNHEIKVMNARQNVSFVQTNKGIFIFGQSFPFIDNSETEIQKLKYRWQQNLIDLSYDENVVGFIVDTK